MEKLVLTATGAQLYQKGLLAEHFVTTVAKVNELVDAANAEPEPTEPGTEPAAISTESLSRRASGVLNRPLVLGTFGGYNNGFSDGVETSRSYSFEPNAAFSASGLQLVFGNFSIGNSYGGGAVAPGSVMGQNDITVKAGIYNGDGFYFFTFNGGQPSVTIKPGQIVKTDRMPYFLKQGGGSNLHTSVSVAEAGMKWPRGVMSRNSSSGELVGGAINGGGQVSYHPIAVLGDPVAPRTYGSVGMVGDSIQVGGGSGTEPADLGYAARALNAAGIPFTRMATYGALLESYTALNKPSVAMDAITGIDHIICNLGVNNMLELQGQGLPAFQARYVTLWKRLAASGAKVHQCTITPYDNTDSGFVSLKAQLNDWIRSVPAPLTSCIDAAVLAETALNSNVYKPGYSDDKLHPNATGTVALAQAINPNLFLV
jgi:lysophospholipase L1-like esterase